MKIVTSTLLLLFSFACFAEDHARQMVELSELTGLPVAYPAYADVADLDRVSASPVPADFFYASLFANVPQQIQDLGFAPNSPQDSSSIVFSYPLADSWMVHAGYSESEGLRIPQVNSAFAVNIAPADAYYLGGSYQMALGWPGSTFTVNMGYANLDTSDIQAARNICNLDEDGCAGPSIAVSRLVSKDSGRQSNSLSAWTYGVVWLIPLSEKMAVNTSFRMSDYNESLVVEGEPFSSDQKTTFFNLGVQYAF